MFALANALWGTLHPLQFVPHTAQPNLELSKAALRFKMDELQQSASAPDIMLIGSSLPMCAFFYTEGPGYFDLAEGKKIRSLKLNLLQAYPEAGYFTAQLKKLSGKHFNVFNFAGAACMASDTKLVVERAVAAGRKPSLIIYGVGLRDFVDNINPPPGETPYYKALCNFPFILRHLPYMMHMNAFNDLTVGALCKMYDLRNEFRISAEHKVCNLLHHPTSIELAFILADLNQKAATVSSATKVQATNPKQGRPSTPKVDAEKTNQNNTSEKSARVASAVVPAATQSAVTQPTATLATAVPTTTTQAPVARTTATPVPVAPTTAAPAKVQPAASTLAVLDYPQRYSPANYKRLNAEMQELKNLIDYCNEQHIKLILINMPVSQGHKLVSPPGLRDYYLKKLNATAAGATLFIDHENDKLPDTNFFDTVHLNPEGAVNFVNELSTQLIRDGLLKSDKKPQS